MIRAMQVRVNKRTQEYGKLYTDEQADDPKIQKELKDLADRQERLGQTTKDIAQQKNR